MVEVIPREEKAARVCAVRTQANLSGVVDVALVEPEVGDLADADAVAAAGEFEAAEAEELDWFGLTDVDDVLLVVGAGDDDLGVFGGGDPDGGGGGAGGLDIPHAVDGVGAGGVLEVVAWLEGGDGLDEGVAVGVGVLDGAFWFGGGP